MSAAEKQQHTPSGGNALRRRAGAQRWCPSLGLPGCSRPRGGKHREEVTLRETPPGEKAECARTRGLSLTWVNERRKTSKMRISASQQQSVRLDRLPALPTARACLCMSRAVGPFRQLARAAYPCARARPHVARRSSARCLDCGQAPPRARASPLVARHTRVREARPEACESLREVLDCLSVAPKGGPTHCMPRSNICSGLSIQPC